MDIQSIVAAIDAEIGKLEKARTILAQIGNAGLGQLRTLRPKRRRRFSKEARERMASAQRKRWATTKREAKATSVYLSTTASTPSKSASRPRRKLSPEARKRIAAAQKRRWAAIKAAKEPVKPSSGMNVQAKKASIKKASVQRSHGVKTRNGPTKAIASSNAAAS